MRALTLFSFKSSQFGLAAVVAALPAEASAYSAALAAFAAATAACFAEPAAAALEAISEDWCLHQTSQVSQEDASWD